MLCWSIFILCMLLPYIGIVTYIVCLVSLWFYSYIQYHTCNYSRLMFLSKIIVYTRLHCTKLFANFYWLCKVLASDWFSDWPVFDFIRTGVRAHSCTLDFRTVCCFYGLLLYLLWFLPDCSSWKHLLTMWQRFMVWWMRATQPVTSTTLSTHCTWWDDSLTSGGE